ncbi:hypothetical protein PpBr36_01795 [Pyricularia pennisetigena]|uniref:hypothetical protein n=1 Tax=Pyricularia pennisetigena TaxID=1578925 RepID=UPI00114DA48A|nr:hypothetical protein PpBr36_01795 [Pyricularia pennisetigena]TLS28871.1 hypothetical protein PpBr36_01795 [Pyricularia pennisetigena]
MAGLLAEAPGDAIKALLCVAGKLQSRPYLASTGRALILREASDGKNTTAWAGAAQLCGGETGVLGA